jgi:cation diffusion facilitator family transporter
MLPEQRYNEIQRVTHIGIVVNLLLSLAQIGAGWLAHSQALIADGLHSLSDLVSDFIVLFTSKHAAKAADDLHPYGHGRFETLSSIILGLILLAVAVGIGIKGVNAISAPEHQQVAPFALVFALLAILSKEFLYRYTMRVAQRIKSTLLEGNAMHHRSDVLSSIVVLVGVGAQVAGIPHMDALAAMVVATLIGGMGLRLIKKAFSELVDTSLDQELVDSIRRHILDNDGVVAVHALRSRSMGGRGLVDTEVRVDPHLSVSEAHYISVSLEKSIIQQFSEISAVSVHIDPVDDDDHDKIARLPGRAETLFRLHSAWEGVKHSDRIREIRLHYLHAKLEVEVFLPAELSAEGNTAQQLHDAALVIDRVGKVTVYYAA